MTYFQQEISTLLVKKRKKKAWVLLWGGTEGYTSWFGRVVDFTATWQISVASVRAQLGLSTPRGDLMLLLTLTAQADRLKGLRYFSFFITPGLLLLSCSIVIGQLIKNLLASFFWKKWKSSSNSSQFSLDVDGCVFTDRLTLLEMMFSKLRKRHKAASALLNRV